MVRDGGAWSKKDTDDTSLEKLKAKVDYSDNEELEAALEALPEESKPEGKVIPINSKKEKLPPEVAKKLSKELSELNKHLKDVELLKEGLALMSKRHKYYAETKEMLDNELKSMEELLTRRVQLENQLFSENENMEIFRMRSLSMTNNESLALDKVRKELAERDGGHPKETALVPQQSQEIEKHKDWGAWRGGRDFLSGGGKFVNGLAYATIGWEADIANWTYRKIKRLMGKGAELDGGKKEYLKTFIDTDGSEIAVTGETRKGEWHIGQKLRLKSSRPYFDQVKDNSTSFEIVGFRKAGDIVVQLDSGKVIWRRDLFDKFYEPISETPEEKEMGSTRIFTDLDGSKIETTGEQEKYGWRVGQKLRLKQNVNINRINGIVALSHSTVIVGFDKKGQVVIQINRERVIEEEPHKMFKYFEPVSETPKDYGTPIKR